MLTVTAKNGTTQISGICTKSIHSSGQRLVLDDECQDCNDSTRDLADLADGASDEPAKAFGKLFSKLSRDTVNEDDFAPFRDLIRQEILDIWPVPAGDVVIGMVQPVRLLHSLQTAAHETGVGTFLLEQFLVEAGAIAADDDRPAPRKTFDARRYARTLEEIPMLAGLSRCKMQWARRNRN